MNYSKLTKEEIIQVIKNNIIKLSDLSDELKDNKEIVLEVVKQDGWSLQYVSERLKEDEEVVLTAMKESVSSWTHISSTRLKNDRNLAMIVVKNSPILELLSAILDIFKDDKEIVLEALKSNSNVFTLLSEKLRDDKEIVLEAVKKNAYVVKCASNRLQNDKEILQILEKVDIRLWYCNNKTWHDERMEVLANLRHKELIESSINPIHKTSKKIKF